MALNLRQGLKDGWAVRTHNRKLACYKAYGKHLGWSEFLTGYKCPSTPPSIPHPLPEGIAGVVLMIEAANKPAHKAMVVLTGLCGLRISESLLVRPSDFQVNTERVLLTVHGKGQKTRVIPLSDMVVTALIPRLAMCAKENERLVPITDRKAREAVTRIGNRALGRDDVASHDLRMTFGTVAYAKCKNIRAVQELLGHASCVTTEGYTFVHMDVMAEAADFG